MMSPILSRRRLIAAVLVSAGMQTLVLGSMISGNDAVLANGAPVLVQAEPVDPRDLLRGDFVTLGYEFASLQPAVIEDWPKTAGSVRLWVRLRPAADGIWHATGASFSPLPPQPESVVLRSDPFDYNPADEKRPVSRLHFGIERYYVPEGQGKALEAARDTHKLVVELHVTDDGTARIATARIEP